VKRREIRVRNLGRRRERANGEEIRARELKTHLLRHYLRITSLKDGTVLEGLSEGEKLVETVEGGICSLLGREREREVQPTGRRRNEKGGREGRKDPR